MKSFRILALMLTTVTLAACGSGNQPAAPSETEIQEQMAMAAQVGQAQAIAQIIERSMAEPCQPINLFNKQDPENPKEINLINVACESLDLPELVPAPQAPESAATPAQTAAPTE